jgi:hypothetical protein
MELQLSRNVTTNLDLVDLAFQEGRGYQFIEDWLHISKMVGIVKAKALWMGEKYWENPSETFRDYAVNQYRLRSETIKRYIDTWDMILQSPENLREYIVRKPMQELIPIGTNLANGSIELEEEDWERLLLATGNGEVSNIIKEMSGKETALRINVYIDMKSGDIESWYDGKREYIGFLDVHAMDKEQVKKSIYRILNKAGIREKDNA